MKVESTPTMVIWRQLIASHNQSYRSFGTLNMSKVLIPVPSYGFDPSEVAIPWKLLRQKHHEAVFATPGNALSSDLHLFVGNRK